LLFLYKKNIFFTKSAQLLLTLNYIYCKELQGFEIIEVFSMATINYAAREINVKIVYYGPALSGKTTNLQVIHKKVPQDSKGDMVSLATESDRTLFFDFLPIDLGKIKGFTTKMQLYTVPGQVYYNATRKLVLRGVDGIVFVADSSKDKLDENIESLDNMEENLSEYGYSLKEIPLVLQYNKRDCENPMSIDELNQKLNRYNSKSVGAIAFSGAGVFDTLKVISKEVIDVLNKKYEGSAAASPITKEEESSWFEEPEAPSAPETSAAPVKEEPIFKAKEESVEQDFIELDIDIAPTPAPVVEEAAQEEEDGLALDIDIDVNPETKVEEAEIPQAAQIEDDFYDASLELDDVVEQPITTEVKSVAPPVFETEIEFEDIPLAPPAAKPAAETQTSIIQDVLDDDHEYDLAAPKKSALNGDSSSQPIDPIRAALERGQGETWAPPEKMLFSSVNKGNLQSSAQIMAQKKKPINPKYQKSFMDNLFKKNSGSEEE